MSPISSDKASEDLSRLIDEVAQSHEPVEILGKGGVAVLIAEEDWRSIQETLHLVSLPGMSDSIREGMNTSVDECSEEPGW